MDDQEGANQGERVDPWGSEAFTNPDQDFADFKIAKIPSHALEFFKGKTFLFDRGLIIRHKDFETILRRIELGEDFLVISGFSSSGELHYGHKSVIDIYNFFRKFTKEGRFAICDLDAYVSRSDEKIPDLATARKYAVDNVADALALGVPEADIRVQSNQSLDYHNFVLQISKSLSFNTMKAVLGHSDLGKFTATYLQIADILYPQLELHGAHSLVPVGIDQEPILSLARDVAKKLRKSHGFISPSSLYTAHLPSLVNMKDKMSKSEKGSALLLNSTVAEIDQTIAHATTGGRDTLQQQIELGGTPGNCPLYYLHRSNNPDTAAVADIYSNCKSGKLMCKDDKAALKELFRANAAAHIERRERFMETAKRIVAR